MTLLTTYFDESAYPNKTTALFYVIAGYVGPAAVWAEFSSAWRDFLAEFGVDSFHATDCEAGRRQFEHLSDAERHVVQARLAELTKRFPILGISVAIALNQHRQFEADLPVAKGQTHMSVPHMLAFRAFVQFVANSAEDAGSNSPIRFVPSDGPYLGRMRDLYGQIKRDVHAPWAKHLGDFESQTSKATPGLQAADHLAYETLRMREQRGGTPLRLQMRILTAGEQVKFFVLSRHFYRRLEYNTNNLVTATNAE